VTDGQLNVECNDSRRDVFRRLRNTGSECGNDMLRQEAPKSNL